MLLLFYSVYNKLMLLSLIVRRYIAATATAKSLQSCLTLCDPIDGSPPGSRQEHWSGLPFPSPMHACIVSCFSPVWLLCPQDSPGKDTGVHCHFLLQL